MNFLSFLISESQAPDDIFLTIKNVYSLPNNTQTPDVIYFSHYKKIYPLPNNKQGESLDRGYYYIFHYEKKN